MRRATLLFTLVATLAGASVCEAGWVEFWQRVKLDWHRMNAWPEPFLHADRELVRLPLIAMTDKGWQLQNTLSDHLFRLEDQSLTQAGALQVRWIVTQAPPHRRTVFVLRGPNQEASLDRVAAVQDVISRLVPEGPRPEVLLTDTIPVGGAGDYFDAVDRQRKQSIPQPRLPEMNQTFGGGNN